MQMNISDTDTDTDIYFQIPQYKYKLFEIQFTIMYVTFGVVWRAH